MAERRDLDEQREDQRDGAKRPDVGAAHDVQRGRGRLAAGQAIRQVGQPVEVKAPAEQGEQPDREPGRGQRPGPERMIGYQQDG